MNEEYSMQWRTCRHCKGSKYCIEKVMTEHEEDCPMRPSQRRMKLCPKCESVMARMTANEWICVSESCDFTVRVLQGGKLQT